MKASVYIGTSLDGFIARTDGALDFLDGVDSTRLGDAYKRFISRIDALVWGRGTYEKVLTFGEWRFEKPVFVVSRTLTELEPTLAGKASLLSLEPKEVMEHLGTQGFEHLYIDGGKLIQSFLAEDLIDEMIVCTLPVLIGNGIPLFGPLPGDRRWHLAHIDVLPHGLVQSYYDRPQVG